MNTCIAFSRSWLTEAISGVTMCETAVPTVHVAGPFGEQDDLQVFIQKVVPETDRLFVRLSSSGQRCVCELGGNELLVKGDG